jgi:undecaprenyl-diphosphatase
MPPPTEPAERPLTIEDAIADVMSDSIAPIRATAARVLRDLSRVDHAAYEAVASTDTPALDEPLRRLSNAANRSAIWIAIAAALALFGGRRGRRAAVSGLVSIGVSSALVNIGVKTIASRRRPDRMGARVVDERHVAMPSSTSFPSGHSASAFAFANAAGRDVPWLAFPLRMLAATVAYSRVHTGVHYPGDAVVGSLIGGATGSVVGGTLDRRRGR